jgi:hypothetical protein
MIPKFLLVCGLLILFVIPASAQPADKPAKAEDSWAPFRFLVGDWVGKGSGDPGKGSGYFSFAPDLDGKILVRKNHAEYPPKEGQKTGAVHDDLLIVYPKVGGAYSAIYFDNEGHVISYKIPKAEPGNIIFESEGTEKEMRFKLTYALQPDGGVEIGFALAAPGQAFKPYLSGLAYRK